MATDTTKITGAADDLSDKLTKGGTAAKTLGAEIANAFNSLDARVAALEAGGTTPPIEPPIEPPPTGNTYGLIENFTAANTGRYKVDGFDVHNQNANKSWSITKLDDYTLRFEIRSGDRESGGNERDEVQFRQNYNEGVMQNWEGTVTVLPGPVSTGSWFSLVQCHATSNVAPTYCPFGIGIERHTDKLQVTLQEPNQSSNNYVYTSPNPIPRGQPMRLKVKVKMAKNGYVGMWWDDKQIVNFNGPVYAANSQYYWKYGEYRGDAPETVKVEFRNVHITTG
jgi:hypothetical protein